MSDLQSQVGLILSQAGGSVSTLDRSSGSSITLSFASFDKPNSYFADLVVASGADSEAQSEQLSLLRVLHSNVPQDSQNDFWAAVHRSLSVKSGSVIGHLIVELQRFDQIPQLSLGHGPYVSAAHTMLWHALRTKLSLQPVMLSDDDVTGLIKMATTTRRLLNNDGYVFENDRPLAAELQATVGTAQRVQYLRLKDQLLKVENPEINTDRKELVSRFEALHFSPRLIAAIDGVERQIRSAATELEFRGCMDLLRVIFEETFEESARQIEARVGTPVPAGASVGNFQPFKQYLENAKLLSPRESEVTQKLYNYVSQEGSHSLASAPEQLRVTKNTIIEWCLMLVGRVQTFVL